MKNNLFFFYKYWPKTIITLLLPIIFLASCETLVNDVDPSRLPRSDSRLVVHGYLSPQDTVIQVNVYLSSQVIGSLNSFGNTPVSLKDASVRISSQSKTVVLNYDPKNGSYSINAAALPILAGQTYTLKASYEGKSVESSCTVPKAVGIKEVRLDSVPSRNVSSSDPNFVPPNDYLYRLVWQDPAGEVNFYRVAGYSLQFLRLQTAPNKFEDRSNLFQINFRDNNRSADFLSDERSDGSLFISATGRYTDFYRNSTSTKILSNQIELILLSCEKTYYDYHRAVQLFDDNNPFAEPSLIPSNIKGGLGCFAAYNRSTIVLKK